MFSIIFQIILKYSNHFLYEQNILTWFEAEQIILSLIFYLFLKQKVLCHSICTLLIKQVLTWSCLFALLFYSLSLRFHFLLKYWPQWSLIFHCESIQYYHLILEISSTLIVWSIDLPETMALFVLHRQFLYHLFQLLPPILCLPFAQITLLQQSIQIVIIFRIGMLIH